MGIRLAQEEAMAAAAKAREKRALRKERDSLARKHRLEELERSTSENELLRQAYAKVEPAASDRTAKMDAEAHREVLAQTVSMHRQLEDESLSTAAATTEIEALKVHTCVSFEAAYMCIFTRL